MNDSPYGLTASIWTDLQGGSKESEAAFQKFADGLETGTVFLNRYVIRSLFLQVVRNLRSRRPCRCDYLDPALAWTGLKDSGRGVSLSKYGPFSSSNACFFRRGN